MEKTFEEICEDFLVYEQMSESQKLFVHNIMQQVREATIAECKNIPLKWVDVYYDEDLRDEVLEPKVNIEAFDNLPTDRIKIEV